MEIINLTPHAVNIVDANGNEILQIPASGTIARCSAETETVGEIIVNGVRIPETRTVMGDVYDLPEEKPGTIYIVSLAVAKAIAKANPERRDLRIPDQSVRNAAGQIVGCRSLGTVF